MAKIKITCPNCNHICQVEENKLPENKQVRIGCLACKTPFPYTKTSDSDVLTPPPPPKEPIVAWLAVHDQDVATQIFPIKLGKTSIGRKKTSSTATIQIEVSDRFMSSSHLEIEVEKVANQLQLLIVAKNHATWLQSKQRICVNDIYYGGDGYVLQMGYTTCILKTAHACKDRQEMEKFVQTFPYPNKKMEG